MNVYLAEFIGTGVLVLLGNGVVANALLKNTKGNTNAGSLIITLAWGLAVFCGVIVSGPFSGAHLNPAVTIGLALVGSFSWDLVVGYILAQIAGGVAGGILVYLFYRLHYNATDDADLKLATFSTGPAIRNYSNNLLSEIIGTFMLVFVILMFAVSSNNATVGMGSLGALPVSLLVMVIGMSLGGTTGYAINPARDLGPRIAHAILPIKGKRDSDWSYSWVPVIGPAIGGALAAALYCVLF
ncbi:Glycerol uptake facilitator protein [termite gut metagenome]|uniref:Glycerol uptake facilitator protein n=1 Tax=termite gut metagenome TaxID=433724 RepID=A0A5J4S019_9ZZZZ